MIDVPTYRKVSGMVLQCIADLGRSPVVVEIGVAEGIGVARYMQLCRRVVGVDALSQSYGDVMDSEQGVPYVPNADNLIDAFWSNVGRGGNVELVVGISQWSTTVAEVDRVLAGDRVDILVIDGTHHPSALVEADFDLYIRFLSDDALVVFDDIYEPDVRSAYDRCRVKPHFVVHEEWKCGTGALQEIGVLRRRMTSA